VARWGTAFLDVYLFEQMVDRATGRLGGWDQSRSYFSSLLRDDWPWLPLSVAGLAMAAVGARRGDRRAAFLLAWAFGYLGLVSLSAGQRARYLVQLYPPASIMAALALDAMLPERWRARAPAAIGALCVAGLLLVVALPRARSDDAAEVRSLGPALERLAPGARAVAAYRMGADVPLRATFLFYLRRDLQNVRDPAQAEGDVIVAYATRQQEVAAAGFVPAFANQRFVVLERQSRRMSARRSLSRRASATKDMTLASCSTHQIFTDWRSDAGTRVASCTSGSSDCLLVAIARRG